MGREQRNVAIIVKKVPEKSQGSWGFAAIDDGGNDTDIFIHARDVGDAGILPAEVRIGDRFIADVVETHKGLRAANLQKP